MESRESGDHDEQILHIVVWNKFYTSSKHVLSSFMA